MAKVVMSHGANKKFTQIRGAASLGYIRNYCNNVRHHSISHLKKNYHDTWILKGKKRYTKSLLQQRGTARPYDTGRVPSLHAER